MFNNIPFKSEREINDAYAEHLESLLASGIEFSETQLRMDWSEAIREFRKSQVTHSV